MLKDPAHEKFAAVFGSVYRCQLFHKARSRGMIPPMFWQGSGTLKFQNPVHALPVSNRYQWNAAGKIAPFPNAFPARERRQSRPGCRQPRFARSSQKLHGIDPQQFGGIRRAVFDLIAVRMNSHEHPVRLHPADVLQDCVLTISEGTRGCAHGCAFPFPPG